MFEMKLGKFLLKCEPGTYGTDAPSTSLPPRTAAEPGAATQSPSGTGTPIWGAASGRFHCEIFDFIFFNIIDFSFTTSR